MHKALLKDGFIRILQKIINFFQKICEEIICCTSVITTATVHSAHTGGML